MSVVGVVGAVLVVAGVIIMLASGPALIITDRIVRRCSKQTEGTLVGQRQHRKRLFRTQSYSPVVRYEINDLPFEGEPSYVDGMGTSHRPETGSKVTVWYNPAKPKMCYVVGSGPLAKRRMLSLSYWVAAGATVLGAILFLFAG